MSKKSCEAAESIEDALLRMAWVASKTRFCEWRG
ncbi:unknown [Firmicutes bacterium CAG:24]|nr:unknown [Firmicutes bacterium CAG:24]